MNGIQGSQMLSLRPADSSTQKEMNLQSSVGIMTTIVPRPESHLHCTLCTRESFLLSRMQLLSTKQPKPRGLLSTLPPAVLGAS